jgi:CubicO group peptidase (beta-lactamase class C family)
MWGMFPRILLWLCVVCAAAAAPTGAELASNPEVASALRVLEAWTESQIAYRGQPGVSMGIVYDQDLVWAKGFGCADVARKIPATPKTVYRMASNTKMFTAIAVMQLRDAGKLNLDDPVAKHLPWFRLKSQNPEAPAVTIRHLLTHTSGLPREAAAPYWTDFRFPTPQQVRELLPTQEPAYPPDTRWKYSNLGLTLAGEIVETVSGERYADYIQRRILDPLGMKDTSLHLPADHRARLAVGYGRRMPDGKREIRPFTDCAGITPAAGLSSTVEDFARFASAQFRGAPILKASTVREMQRVHWIEPDWKSGWGLGFSITRDGDRTLIGHGGSLAGYRTQTSISIEEKIAVLVMTNSDDGNPGSYVRQAFRYVAPAIKKAASPEKKPPALDPAWKKYAGLYRSPWGDTQVLEHGGELVAIDPTSDDPLDGVSRLTPVRSGVFRLESKRGGAAVGELVSFEEDSQGRVVRIKVGDNYSQRVERW